MTTDELETATAWFKQYNSRGDNYFDYFNFADTFKGLSQTNVDLIYLRTLQSGKKQVRDSAIRYQIDTELNRFKRKNNINSPFGQQYSNYWDKLSATQMVDILGKRTLQAIENGHESLVKAASNTVKKVCDNFLNSNNAEKEEPTASSQESNRDTTNKNTDVQCSSSSNDESATTLKKLLKDREDIQKFAGSFDLVGQLGIIDLTLPDVAKKVEKLVQTRWAENLKLPSWSPDEPCKRFISQIKASSPNPHLLRLAARDSTTIDPKQFDIYEHNNLRVLEFITEFWLDLIQAPVNIVLNERIKERTFAVSTTIPLLNSLFRQFNDTVELQWLEVQTPQNRHKWDGIGLANNKVPIVSLLVELSGGTTTTDDKVQSDLVKVYRNAKRALNAIANVLDNKNLLRLYCCQYENKKLHFESLTLVDNAIYVRKRHVSVKFPSNGKELKEFVLQMERVFSWRDGVLELSERLKNANSIPQGYFSEVFMETASPPSTP